MNIPDYWIKTIKEKVDEDWKPSSMFWEVTNRRADEKTISYAKATTKPWWATRPSSSA